MKLSLCGEFEGSLATIVVIMVYVEKSLQSHTVALHEA